MNVELRPYQKDALRFILNRKKSGLFLSTGLGKTLVSLLYLKILDVPAMVVVEASKKNLWLNENDKFEIGLHMSTSYNSPAKILIVSYDWLKENANILTEYDVVVLDESMKMAGTETQRYAKMFELLSTRERLVLLSGYPVENHLQEIYGQVSLITDVLGKNYYHFLHRYFRVIRRNNRIIKAEPKVGSFVQIINAIKPFVFLADKSKEVTVKNEIVTYRYELSDYQKDIIQDLRDGGRYVDDNVTIECPNVMAVYMKVMQIISGFVYQEDDTKELCPYFFKDNPKLQALDSIIKDKRNFLLWYLYNAEGNMLSKYQNYCRLSKLSTDARGLNLQSYDFAVYFTLPLSGGQFLQSVDRLYRIGRVKDVLSIVLLPKGEFGDRLAGMMNRKQKLTSVFIKSLMNTSI